MGNSPLLKSSELVDLLNLEKKIQESLSKRLEGQADYTISEINKIESLSKRLIPPGTSVSEENQLTIRALAMLSQCELKPSANIKSHRRFLGPLIVFLKKASWPFVKIHLKRSFEALEEFNSWVVYSQAKQICAISKIEKISAESVNSRK